MYFSTITIAAVAALFSSTLALPTENSPTNGITTTGDVIAIIHKPSTSAITKRGATDVFGDFTGQKSSYPDGSGKYVRSEDVHRYASRDKCWTDLFFVRNATRFIDYQRVGTIDCPTTSECEAGVDTGISTCNEISITISAGFEANILKDIISVSGGIETTTTESKCETKTTKSTCKWAPETDGTGSRCHAIWTAATQRVNYGYIRRRCDFHDGKGDKTVWSKDVEFSEKANELHLGCKADCAATTYA
ncbi:hypothetical protein B0J11DRAFT_243061 [Dendryphion nanum]|uniref:Uncharacterized protein n=1 Tax=Dendryphion nanum TaxID=256645 RepID=A0A9P9IR28_9PLEO|nr:hypothetical protein B0J11DRAFT_243061 [Dendryphion nanum]